MKKTILYTLLISLSWFSFAQQIEHFEGTPEEAFNYASKKKKPIIVDFYTSWCGFCKKLDKTTFINSDVVKMVNKNYVMYKLDAESAEGRPLAKEHQVTGYPCILIFDQNGNVIGRINGYVNADKFLTHLETLKDVKADAPKTQPVVSKEASLTLNQIFDTKLDSLKNAVLFRFDEKQRSHLLEAEMWGAKNNIFEFDELTYTAQNYGADNHLPYLPLFFALGQGIDHRINEEVQNLFENEILTAAEMNYLALYLLTNAKVNILSLRMINEAALTQPDNFDFQLTKVAVQKFYGDVKDAESTAKKAKKIASKQKLDATLIDVVMSM